MMSPIVFNPNTLLKLIQNILRRFQDEKDFVTRHVHPLLRVMVNHVFADNSFVLGEYNDEECKRIEQELIPEIRNLLKDYVSTSAVRCRIDFVNSHLAKLYEYNTITPNKADKLLETIELDILEGNHHYPKHIVDIVTASE